MDEWHHKGITEDDVQLYIDFANDPDLNIQREAYLTLIDYVEACGTEQRYAPILLQDQIVDLLKNGLQSASADIRAMCLGLLYDLELGCIAGVDYALRVKGLYDDESQVRLAALLWFHYASFGCQDPEMQQLLKLASDDTEIVAIRVAALDGLGAQTQYVKNLSSTRLQHLKEAYAIAVSLSHHDNRNIRLQALNTALRIAPPPHPDFKSPLPIPQNERQTLFDLLKSMLTHDDIPTRQAVINMLSWYPDEDTLESVGNMVNDTNRQVQSVTCRILAHRYTFEQAEPYLLQALASDALFVPHAAIKAIIEILPPDQAKAYLEQKLESSSHEWQVALELLAKKDTT